MTPGHTPGMTLYEVLGVHEKAHPAVIAAAWKAQMRIYHTDGSAPDERIARSLNDAHDILSVPAKRAKYDFDLSFGQRKSAATPSAQYGTPPVRPVGGAPANPMDVIGQRLGEFFGRVLSHFENVIEEELDMDPGHGTLYRMPNPVRRKRRARRTA